MKLSDLISNSDGRLSTTATAQLTGFIACALVLAWAVACDKAYVPDLYNALLLASVGTAATKGVAGAINKGGA